MSNDSAWGQLSGFLFGIVCSLFIWAIIMINLWESDLIDERVNKICIEAKYKKYQLDLCDKYSPEFRKLEIKE